MNQQLKADSNLDVQAEQLEMSSIPETPQEAASLHLKKVRQRQSLSQTDMLRQVNDALSKSLNKANELVEVIRLFRTSTGQKRSAEKKPVSCIMQDAVHHVLNTMLSSFPLNQITVLKIIPKDLPPVLVPQDHFETILYHLAAYARHRIGESVGIITIEGSEKALAVYGEERLFHEIRVSFTSPDLAMEDASRLFDPFFEGDEQEKQSRFGLFVAKKLVEHHSGVIAVKTSPRSTSFSIEFPAV